MILHIHGKLKPYYVQTLAMVFFPGVKFPEGEEPSPEIPEGTVTLDEDESEVRAVVTLRCGGIRVSGVHFIGSGQFHRAVLRRDGDRPQAAFRLDHFCGIEDGAS